MNEPHGVLLCISPLIGKLMHTGEIMPRSLDLEEIQVLGISPQEILQTNFSSYEEAALWLRDTMIELKRKYDGQC